jgi:hypothetical protein
VTSYLLRRLRVPYESLRLPLLVLAGLGLFAWLGSGQASGGGEGHTALMDRSRAMQMLCVWIALLQTFAATSDAIVLFSCVPCMSLIALVSTTSTETEVQYAFLVFVAAATFLMVHENYLRTRRGSHGGTTVGNERKLFGGQLQLAIACVVCAFLLANLVAIPMHAFGRSLVLANGWGQANSFPSRTTAALAGLLANDSQTMPIGTGPVTESDIAVMRIEAVQGRNWRGNTYDYYSGRTFENRLIRQHQLKTVNEAAEVQEMQQPHPVGDQPDDKESLQFKIPQSLAAEPPRRSLHGTQTVQQSVSILYGGMAQCYSAGYPLIVTVPRDQNLMSTDGGAVFSVPALPVSARYRVTSVIPTDDENTLRSASSSVADVPPPIADRYLQLIPVGGQENARLREIAASVTAGIQNNYDKAVAIRNYISATCKYNLQAPAIPGDVDRVEYFLTVSRQGYCDSFAASMTMLSRYAGIPARVAAGYLPGDADGKGAFVVRQKHKHAWTELFFPGVGWVTFDATDGSDDISDHIQHKQTHRVDFIAWLFSHGLLPPLLLLSMIGLMAYLMWTEMLPKLNRSRLASGEDGRPATNRAVIGAYLQACSYLDRRGLQRPRSATPGEFLAAVRPNLSTLSPAAVEALTSLTALHDRFRYSREVAADTEVREAQVCSAAIRGALSRVSARALAAPITVQQST